MIRQAVEALRRGECVGMPTETVYGLAADARSEAAVARIFALKGRPSNNPLIVHIHSIDAARTLVRWTDRAQLLAETFWPGAVTLVLPRRAPQVNIPTGGTLWDAGGPSTGWTDQPVALSVSAGRDTLAVRMPDHPVALELLEAFDGPLAAPSANRSNHVSPTTAAHVREEFSPAELPIILDGGPCQIGLESSVLDLSRDPPVLLRPGRVTRGEIESRIGLIEVFSGHVDPSIAAASPGQHAKHYAPRSPARAIAVGQTLDCEGVAYLRHGPDPTQAMRTFYDTLRSLDRSHPALIAIELPPATIEWNALRDRVVRATSLE